MLTYNVMTVLGHIGGTDIVSKKTCYKFTAVQVVRVADVIVAEAADAVVVE